MIRIQNLYYSSGGKVLLDDITADFSGGRCWAVTGPNGSGKSLLAMIMSGTVKASSGSVFSEGRIGYASFELQQRIMADERRKDNSRFMQGGIDPGTLVLDFIMAGSDPGGKGAFVKYASMFALEGISDRGLRYLSTGEFRKVLLCRALVSEPDILIVDDPFDGLDISSRENLQQLLRTLADSGKMICIATPRTGEIPDWVTHALFLENGKVMSAGRYNPESNEKGKGQPCLNGGWGKMTAEVMEHHSVSAGDSAGKNSRENQNTIFPGDSAGRGENPPVICMNDVSVSYDGVRIVSGINWRVEKGERWKITGPNGCGKSTLMSLVNGDNQKAYQNDISLFGKKRGSGETVWDIKKRIGYVSGDLQMNYRVRATVLETVLSGFFDSIGLYHSVSGLQRAEALNWLEVSGLAAKKDTPFRELSYGEKRTALLVRALVKQAELVILDEPTQGLDEKNTAAVIDVINMLSGFSDVTILLVTHEMFACPESFKRHLSFFPSPDGGYSACVV